jgi:hypothetical protein
MRCLACGAQMILMNVVEDSTMTVPGFEHHTFICSECHDTERRLVFARHGHEGDAAPTLEQTEPRDTEPVPELAALPIARVTSDNKPVPELAALPIPGGQSDTELVPELAALPVPGGQSDTELVPGLTGLPVFIGQSDNEPVPELAALPVFNGQNDTEPVPWLTGLPVFIGQIDSEPMPVLFTTPSTAPASTVRHGRAAALGFFRNAFAKIRGR